MHLNNHEIATGFNADMIVLGAKDVHQALQFQSERLYVLRRGEVIAETKIERKMRNSLVESEILKADNQ